MESQRNNHRRGSRPSVGYLLFQYQSELTRRHAEPQRLSRTKINIIDTLVSRTIRQLKHCSVEELQACKRELVYKEQLRDELRGLRRRKNTGSSSATAASNCARSRSSSSSSTRSRSSSRSSSNSSSRSHANSSCSASSSLAKAPNTPPKPRASLTATAGRCPATRVTIFGPEIFV